MSVLCSRQQTAGSWDAAALTIGTAQGPKPSLSPHRSSLAGNRRASHASATIQRHRTSNIGQCPPTPANSQRSVSFRTCYTCHHVLGIARNHGCMLRRRYASSLSGPSRSGSTFQIRRIAPTSECIEGRVVLCN